MDIQLIIIAVTGFVVFCVLFLNVIASIALFKTDELSKLQKLFQLLFVWLVPFAGSLLVLNLLSGYDPDSIPRRWVPNEKINSYLQDMLGLQAQAINRATRHELGPNFSENSSSGSGND